MKRISYNWIDETVIAFITVLLLTPFILITMESISHSELSFDIMKYFPFTFIFILIPVFFIGLAPILNTGKSMQTLFKDDRGRLHLKKKLFDIDTVERIGIVHMYGGENYFHYYKVYLKKTRETQLKQSVFYLAEMYSIVTFFTHFFKNKLDVVEAFKQAGIDDEQIVDEQGPTLLSLFKGKNNA